MHGGYRVGTQSTVFVPTRAARAAGTVIPATIGPVPICSVDAGGYPGGRWRLSRCSKQQGPRRRTSTRAVGVASFAARAFALGLAAFPVTRHDTPLFPCLPRHGGPYSPNPKRLEPVGSRYPSRTSRLVTEVGTLVLSTGVTRPSARNHVRLPPLGHGCHVRAPCHRISP